MCPIRRKVGRFCAQVRERSLENVPDPAKGRPFLCLIRRKVGQNVPDPTKVQSVVMSGFSDEATQLPFENVPDRAKADSAVCAT
ncbi:hypothetical protein V7x_55460 [Crateriforma conspicua]|uniref:Uncharacterized protein n=1 Tax=Crateriforma conspicua TaxID=2527996 RepID=A0A5C6FIY9_9PLAN|nr:hypothetical protein V7x_55460 [Crateriforma conspicua]